MRRIAKPLLNAVIFSGLALCGFATPAQAGTVIEFYNTNLDNYFITADSSEAADIDKGSAGPGWSRTGNTFESGGSTSVCRFYGSQSPGPNSHFYTVDAGECAYLKQLQASTPATQKRWNFESLDFVATPPANGVCTSGTVPVYRAYNKGSTRGIDSNHRITSSLTAIQEVVNRGWANEGVVMCSGASGSSGGSGAQPVYVVLFTHIEDNTPTGTLGTAMARTNYLLWRDRTIQMAELARGYSMTWVLQPDWKFLEAARLYEDGATMASTGGQNLLRYLRDNLGVVIDPHSHESGDYNYTDVAYLLEQLGVGGTTVIGGYVWDPSLPQFAHWERFRVPVVGLHYPTATWRGDILIGAGTPNHTNDPIVSGVWRPKAPTSYFEDDPSGNISNVGAYRGDIAGITTLRGLSESGRIDASCILTNTFHVTPAMISSTASLATLELDVLLPLKNLRASGQVEITDFSSLVAAWKTRYASKGCLYQE